MNKKSINKFSFSTNDYDEFTQMLTVANAEQELLEGGTFVGKATLIASQNVILNVFDINRKVLQRGVGTPGFITFTLFDPKCLFNWRKHTMKKGMIGILYANEHESVTGANFKGLPIAVKTEHFEQTCIKLGFPDIIDKVKRKELIYVSDLKLTRIRQLITELSQSPYFKDDELYFYLEKILVDLLVDCLADAINQNSPKEFHKKDFRQVVDFIHSNISEVSSVSNLSLKTHYSERTLRRWFKKNYDISPKQYLNFIRLNMVRKNLKNKKEGSSIFQIASEYNFWHMGQFSKDYKNLFGELPSTTIDLKNG